MIKKRLIYALLLPLLVIFCKCDSDSKSNISYQNEYHKNGKLLSATPFVDGKAHGTKLEYYDTGIIRKEVPFENGKVNGIVKTFYANGKLYSETPQEFGKINGVTRKYYENGKLLSETIYVDGNLQPGLKEYDKKGNLREEYSLVFTKNHIKRNRDVMVILNISVTPAVASVSFTQIVEGNELGVIVAPIPMNGKEGELSFVVPNNSIVNQHIMIEAKFTTRYHNNGTITNVYNLRVN